MRNAMNWLFWRKPLPTYDDLRPDTPWRTLYRVLDRMDAIPALAMGKSPYVRAYVSQGLRDRTLEYESCRDVFVRLVQPRIPAAKREKPRLSDFNPA
jgi:hypothetical protein